MEVIKKSSIRIGTLAIIGFALLSANASADDYNPPPWRLSNPSCTVQEWDFNTPATNLAPDGNIWGGTNWVNPFGTPMANIAGGTYQPTFGSHVGSWMLTLPTDQITLRIPNHFHQTAEKTVWIQITWFDAAGAGPAVGITSSSFTGPATLIDAQGTADGWMRTTYAATFGPCPEVENVIIRGQTAGAVALIDQVVIDTICNPVPEPASMAALGLGAIGLIRKRRKRA